MKRLLISLLLFSSICLRADTFRAYKCISEILDVSQSLTKFKQSGIYSSNVVIDINERKQRITVNSKKLIIKSKSTEQLKTTYQCINENDENVVVVVVGLGDNEYRVYIENVFDKFIYFVERL